MIEMIEMNEHNTDELYHFGIKGQKWGVRRYQNKDGSLTPTGAKRLLKDDYKAVGATRSLGRRHGYDESYETKTLYKSTKAMKRLASNNDGKKYTNKQKAKDYDTAIRGMQKLRDNQLTKSFDDGRMTTYNDVRLSRLNDKKMTNSRQKKISKMVADNEIMQLRLAESVDQYKAYSKTVDKLVKAMSNDKSVVYTTRRKTHANSNEINSEYLSISNTDYKVRGNTKHRENSN